MPHLAEVVFEGEPVSPPRQIPWLVLFDLPRSAGKCWYCRISPGILRDSHGSWMYPKRYSVNHRNSRNFRTSLSLRQKWYVHTLWDHHPREFSIIRWALRSPLSLLGRRCDSATEAPWPISTSSFSYIAPIQKYRKKKSSPNKALVFYTCTLVPVTWHSTSDPIQ